MSSCARHWLASFALAYPIWLANLALFILTQPEHRQVWLVLAAAQTLITVVIWVRAAHNRWLLVALAAPLAPERCHVCARR